MSETYGGAILARALKSAGAEAVFHLLGGPMNAAGVCASLGMRLIDVRHEAAAAHMAHAYTRVSGRPGVCMTGAGVDTINLTTGLVTAFMDCTPVIAVSGSASINTHAMEAFQDVDQVSVMRPLVKASLQVPTTERIPSYVGTAFRTAVSGKPGPVYLDFPANVLTSMIDESKVEPLPEPPIKHRPLGDWAAVRQAADILSQAERPLIMSGSGVIWSQASAELQQLVEITSIPFFTTPVSRGVIPEDHPLCFGGARTLAWREADAILVVGARPSFILSYLQPPRVSAHAKVIVVNIDPEAIGLNRRADVGIQGDAKAVLRQLIDEAGPKFAGRGGLPWVERLSAVDMERQNKTLSQLNSNQTPINPLRLMKEVKDFLPRDSILVVDGHETLNHARQTIPTYYPGHRLNPGVSGCMGVGVPFGIGAKVAKPDKPVVVLTGDGAFGMNGMEFDTAVRHKLPIVVVINNNGGWLGYRESPEGSQVPLGFNQRYDLIAQALGGYGERVDKPEDLRGAIERAFESGKPAILNVITDHRVRSSTQVFAADMGLERGGGGLY